MGGWTTPADVTRTLRRRWDAGEFLTARATGQEWQALGIPVRCPTARELASDFGAAQAWVAEWGRADRHGLRLDYRTVGGRLIGVNELPSRAWIDSYQQLCTFLRVEKDARRFAELLDVTRSAAPRLVNWMAANPTRTLSFEATWKRLVDTVLWVDQNARTGMYLRQVDVPAVDTKFIEQHRGILTDLLDQQLAEDRIDPKYPRSDFIGRYRFQGKPAYVRLRPLAPIAILPQGFTEYTLRLDEAATTPLGASTVYVVENEITYLAFPQVDNALVIFGGGYMVSQLGHLSWLADRQLVYWSDLDTHGFTMLNQLRRRFPHVRSMLMDRETLLTHETQWVSEARPTRTHLESLHPDEADLYRDLVEDALGRAVRLEQERISYKVIQRALRPATDAV